MAQLRQKLNRKNGLLAKLRHLVSSGLLKTIYFVLFDSHMCYAAQVWGLGNSNIVDMIQKPQNKALRIICFKERADPLYTNHKILKLHTKISLH